VKDQKGVQFVLTTVIGGVLFLVPLVFLGIILTKAAGYMMVIAEPLAEWIPIDQIGGIALANLLALAAVVLVCFLAGLVARHALAGKFVKNLEAKVLAKVPGYSLVKGMVSGFNASEAEGFKPIALELGTAQRFGFEIQKLRDGRSMVYIPSVPSPWSGITQVLPPDQITYLDVPVTKIIELAENYGYGLEDALPVNPNQDEGEAGITSS
jgi:uncharacterized membrane protein